MRPNILLISLILALPSATGGHATTSEVTITCLNPAMRLKFTSNSATSRRRAGIFRAGSVRHQSRSVARRFDQRQRQQQWNLHCDRRLESHRKARLGNF